MKFINLPRGLSIILLCITLVILASAPFSSAEGTIDDVIKTAGAIKDTFDSVNYEGIISTIGKIGSGFTFEVSPTEEIDLPNCGESEPIYINVHNPLALSSVIVTVNGEYLCRVKNKPIIGTDKTCILTLNSNTTGKKGTGTITLLIAAIAEPGSYDNGTGAYEESTVLVNHIITPTEANSQNRINSLKFDMITIGRKMDMYEGWGYSMDNARRILNESNEYLNNSDAYFMTCNFSRADNYTSLAGLSLKRASDRAEADYLEQKQKRILESDGSGSGERDSGWGGVPGQGPWGWELSHVVIIAVVLMVIVLVFVVYLSKKDTGQ